MAGAAGIATTGLGVAAVGASGALGIGLGGAILGLGVKVASMTDQVKKASAEVGAAVKSTLLSVAGPVAGAVTGVLENFKRTFVGLTPVFRSLFQQMAPLLTDLGNQGVQAFDRLVRGAGSLLTSVTPLLRMFGDHLTPMLDAVGRTLQNIVAPLSRNAGAFGDLLSAVERGLPALGALIGQLVQLGAQALPLVLSLLQTLGSAFRPVVDQLAGLGMAILPSVTQALGTVGRALADGLGKVLPVVGEAINTIAPVLANLAIALFPALASVVSALLPVLATLAQTVGDALAPLLPAIADGFVMVARVVGQLLEGLRPLIPILVDMAVWFVAVANNLLTALAPVVVEIVRALMPALQELLPIIMDLARTIGVQLADAFVRMGPSLVELARAFGDFLIALKPLIVAVGGLSGILIQAMVPVIEAFALGLAKILGWLEPLAPVIVALIAVYKLWVVWQGLLNAVMLLSPIGWMALAIGGLVAAFALVVGALVLLWRNWNQVWNWIKDHKAIAIIVGLLLPPVAAIFAIVAALKFLQRHWGQIWEDVTDALRVAAGAIGSIVGVVVRFFTRMWHEVASAASSMWHDVTGWVGRLYRSVTDFFRDLYRDVTDWFRRTWRWLAEAAGNIWEDVTDPIRDLWRDVAGFFRNLYRDVTDVFRRLWRWLAEAATNIWRDVTNWVKRLVRETVGFFRDLYRDVTDVFRRLWRWLAEAAGNIWRDVTNWMRRLRDNVVGFFRDLYRDVTDVFRRMWRWLAEAAGNIWRDVTNWVRRLVRDVTGFFRDLYRDVTDVFRRLWRWLAEAATNIWRDVTGAFGRLRDGVIGAVEWTVYAVRRIWDGMKRVFAAPINAVIFPIVRNFAHAVDAVTEFVGLHRPLQWAENIPNVKLARGGRVPGTGTGDVVPALLEPGEYVIRKQAAAHWGPELLRWLNSHGPGERDPNRRLAAGVGRYQTGGSVVGVEGTVGGGGWFSRIPIIGGLPAVGRMALDVAEWALAQGVQMLRSGAAGAFDAAYRLMRDPLAKLLPDGRVPDMFMRGVDKVEQHFVDWIRGKEVLGDLTGGAFTGEGTAWVHGKVRGLNAEFVRRMDAMAGSVRTHINVTSGLRDRALQAVLYARYLAGQGALAARPGTSNHEKGLAADITPGRSRFGGIAGRHQLMFPVPSEGWHIEPVRGAMLLAAAGFAGGAGLRGSAVKAIAAGMLGRYGWGADQMHPLDLLWTRESGWNPLAINRSSGAYGIPQSLPGSKMASAGADWRTNPVTQIAWGLGYIRDRYGSPAAAWGHSQRTGWYRAGIPYVPADGWPAMLHRGERVLTARDNANYSQGGDTFNIDVHIEVKGGDGAETARLVEQRLTASLTGIASRVRAGTGRR